MYTSKMYDPKDLDKDIFPLYTYEEDNEESNEENK
jgi:hypothetical protein